MDVDDGAVVSGEGEGAGHQALAADGEVKATARNPQQPSRVLRGPVHRHLRSVQPHVLIVHIPTEDDSYKYYSKRFQGVGYTSVCN